LTTFLTKNRSAWFEVVPLPDDQYEIVYKTEHHKAVLRFYWPDLMTTYHKAKALLGPTKQDEIEGE